MIERTSRRMARDRARLAALRNLSSWQEAARRHAHEMRTPLTGARLELERLESLLVGERLQNADEILRVARSASQEIDRLGSFAQEFSAFARLPRPERKRHDLGELLSEFTGTYGGAWPHLELAYEPVGEPLPVAVDRDMLRQVLVNLCDNAALAIGERGGQMTLKAGTEGENVVLRVCDDGPGSRSPSARVCSSRTPPHGRLARVWARPRHLQEDPARSRWRSRARSDLGGGDHVPGDPAGPGGRRRESPDMTRALIVEDDAKIRANLIFQLREEGLEPRAVESAESALEILADPPAPSPDLLLLDVRLPGLSGIDLVRRLVERGGLPPTIILSGEASISETVEALRLGVHDFIEKPFSKERLLQSIRNTLKRTELEREVARLRSELGDGEALLGVSPALERLREQIARAAPTDARILIRGESGTGKELVANALHGGSPRAAEPFIKINCAAIPTHLVEDELFGHARGAFTDARQAKPGLFEEAHGGTLFLDEIGDMDLQVQSRLLRVLEDGLVRRLGETRDREVDVRVLAATHCDLERAVERGEFRGDLYFRLAHLPIEVPPLRDRPEDARLLFDHFSRALRPAPSHPAAERRRRGVCPTRALSLAGQRPGAQELVRAAGDFRQRSDHRRRAAVGAARRWAGGGPRDRTGAPQPPSEPEPAGLQGAVREGVHRECAAAHAVERLGGGAAARHPAHLPPSEDHGVGDKASGERGGGGRGPILTTSFLETLFQIVPVRRVVV